MYQAQLPGTDNHSPSVRKAGFPETEILMPSRPLLQPPDWSRPSLLLGEDTELTPLGLLRKLWVNPSPNKGPP